MITIKKGAVVVFDLDDTLYSEFDFLASAYWNICEKVEPLQQKRLFKKVMSLYFNDDDIFAYLINHYPVLNRDIILKMYREHTPELKIYSDAFLLINKLKEDNFVIGIITDGRSITQRNKIKGLQLEAFIDDVIISEETGVAKPSELPFKYFEEKYRAADYYYIGDNIKKDFIAANKLGWKTIGVRDREFNIHAQDIENIDSEYLPQYFIHTFNEIMIDE